MPLFSHMQKAGFLMSQLSGFIEFLRKFSFCVIGYVLMKTVVLIYSSLLSAQLFITVFEAGNVLFCLFIVAVGLEQSHSIGIMPIMKH